MKEDHTCAICGNTVEENKTLYAIPTPDADQEQIWVCEQCLPLFEKKRFLFKVLDGPTYTEENRPPFWKNATALYYQHFHITRGQLPHIFTSLPEDTIALNQLDTTQLPFEQFPLIEDFEVILEKILIEGEDEVEKNTGEYHPFFFSPLHGYLAYLLMGDYECPQLCKDDFIIPIGDFTFPYFDFDWGWAILIAADDSYVYILTGGEKDYSTWFKVEKKLYYEQWDKAIRRCRQLCSQ